MRVHMKVVIIVFITAFLVACSNEGDNPFLCADTGRIYSDSEILEAGVQFFNEYASPTWTDTFSIAPLDVAGDKERCCWVHRPPRNKSQLEKIRDFFGFEAKKTIIEGNIKFSATANITEESEKFWARYKDDRESLWTIEYGYSVNECLEYIYASNGAYPALD